MNDLFSASIKNTPPSFIRTILSTATRPEIISFAGGLPNPISFPQEEFKSSCERIIDTYKESVFQYSSTEGLPALREWIAQRFNQKFQTDITQENVLLTTGSQQALDLLGKVLINPGDRVAIEEPGYLGAIQAFSQYRPSFVPVQLELDGLSIRSLESALEAKPKFLYTVPNFQNPTGITYSNAKRNAISSLLKDSQDTILVEDDPYGELLFTGEPFPHILGGKTQNSVLLGSFSKTVTPGMRIGFVISKNMELLRYMNIAKQAGDLHTNIFSQYLMYDYLTHNDYDAHIRTIRALYQRQASAMVNAMEKYFPKTVTFTKPAGGMFLWVTLPEGVSSLALFEKALAMNVAYVPGDPFYTGRKDVNTMRLNFTNADEATIEEGIKRLSTIL